MKKIVLIRHGESLWNKDNKFTGWVDVGLSEHGEEEAMEAGRKLKELGFNFRFAYTSYLKRAIKTLWIILEEMDLMWIPVEKCWRLNEKHYGVLQGLNKKETADQYGEDQVLLWRRSFSEPPPPLPGSDPLHPSNDPRYNELSHSERPSTESLNDTINRIIPYWDKEISKSLEKYGEVIIAAHGNSLRGIVKYLKNMSNEDIINFNIPTAVPYVFEFDDKMNLQKDYFVGDPDEIKRKMDLVASQGKK